MSSNDLVTLAEVKGMLKFEHSSEYDDVRLSLLIGSCSESILRFIKSDGDEFRDSNGDIVTGNIPDDIKLATVTFVGIMDRYPDGEDKLFKSDYLPAQVESILHSRREPTLA
jgi:hypothetical protein